MQGLLSKKLDNHRVIRLLKLFATELIQRPSWQIIPHKTVEIKN